MANDIYSRLEFTHASDLSIAKNLGSKLENANSAFKSAVSTGDQAQISAAKIELDKAQEKLMGFMAVKDKMHDLIMQLIQMIRD